MGSTQFQELYQAFLHMAWLSTQRVVVSGIALYSQLNWISSRKGAKRVNDNNKKLELSQLTR